MGKGGGWRRKEHKSMTRFVSAGMGKGAGGGGKGTKDPRIYRSDSEN